MNLKLAKLKLMYSLVGMYDFFPLLSLSSSKIYLLPHQILTTYKALNDFKGNCIVADEVGLGKTIEAGIIIKDLLLKKEINNCLILAPSSLVYQWKRELKSKFLLDFSVFRKDKPPESSLIISSYETAVRNYRFFYSIHWDLVIVDEAHKLKNKNSIRYKFIYNLPKKRVILLTATPIQNNLLDLYNLIKLVDKNFDISEKTFKEKFFGDKAGREIKNAEELRYILRNYMIRNRRCDKIVEDFLTFPKRNVKTIYVHLSKKEKRIYEKVVKIVRENSSNKLMSFSLLKIASSNVLNSLRILEKYFGIKENISSLIPSKLNYLVKILENIEDYSVIFTEFLTNLKIIAKHLKRRGFNIFLFYGGLSQKKRMEIVEKFKEKGGVLLCTDAGAEGINLQFCNNLINFDLPWNPMKVEQRIGRVHRIGQRSESVTIFNLVNKDTLEEYILELLFKKINLFKATIGELDEILGNCLKRDIEHEIFLLFKNSRNEIDFKKKLEDLSNKINKYKDIFKKVDYFDRKVFETFDLTPYSSIDSSKLLKELSFALFTLKRMLETFLEREVNLFEEYDKVNEYYSRVEEIVKKTSPITVEVNINLGKISEIYIFLVEFSIKDKIIKKKIIPVFIGNKVDLYKLFEKIIKEENFSLKNVFSYDSVVNSILLGEVQKEVELIKESLVNRKLKIKEVFFESEIEKLNKEKNKLLKILSNTTLGNVLNTYYKIKEDLDKINSKIKSMKKQLEDIRRKKKEIIKNFVINYKIYPIVKIVSH